MEITPLYGGEILLEFNPKNHQYRVVNKGRKYKVPSVTKVLGIIDKSGPLMGWAVNSCLDLVRGAIAPNEPHSEVFLETVYEQAKRAHRGLKSDAADVGKQVHLAVEQYILTGAESSSSDDKVRAGFSAAKDWLQSRDIQFQGTERPIYSRRHRYTGTLDGIARVDGILSLIDWKSSNHLYVEYILQLAAYWGAYEEETGERIDRAYLIRLGKEDGIPEPHEILRDSLRRAYGVFLHALALHRGLEKLRKKIIL